MKKMHIAVLVLILSGFLIFLLQNIDNSPNNSKNTINNSVEKVVFTEEEADKVISNLYEALINKDTDAYVNYIEAESLAHLSSDKNEVKKNVDDYLKENNIKNYEINSIVDFNDNTKTINTKYTEVAKNGSLTEHDDLIFLRKNYEDNTVKVIYNGAISSKSYPKQKVGQGTYKFMLEKTIELLDGIGVTIYFENNTDYKVSIGYGDIYGNITITTEDGEVYNIPFDEITIYEPYNTDKISSFTFETNSQISKVEVNGIFELKENGMVKEGSPKSLVVYEKTTN
ncbi:hypothetical protein [Clostridium sp.]|uniref:hypothetical protein n=1 Tax=Clostridium sp. TaxID=1506 RepID=UPI002FC960D9